MGIMCDKMVSEWASGDVRDAPKALNPPRSNQTPHGDFVSKWPDPRNATAPRARLEQLFTANFLQGGNTTQ